MLPYEKVPAQEMPDLRDGRVLRGRYVRIDDCEDEGAVADMGRRDVVGRRKGSRFVKAISNADVGTYLGGHIPALESVIPGWTVIGGSKPPGCGKVGLTSVFGSKVMWRS